MSIVRSGLWHVDTDVPTQRPSTISLRGSLFNDAVAIVATEYDRQLELDEVARRVATSRRQLQRAFSEIGNTTFRSHLTEVRMARAAEMLALGGRSVREIASDVGYRQPAQFAKAFRRHYGCSPSEYRGGPSGRGKRDARFAFAT